MVLNEMHHQKQTNMVLLEKLSVEVGPVVTEFIGIYKKPNEQPYLDKAE